MYIVFSLLVTDKFLKNVPMLDCNINHASIYIFHMHLHNFILKENNCYLNGDLVNALQQYNLSITNHGDILSNHFLSEI